jgi:hypothetical protein
MIKQLRSSWRGSSGPSAQLGGQDKRREVRAGGRAEVVRNISVLQRGAFLARNVRFSASPCKITESCTSRGQTACCQGPLVVGAS